jgi:hypothetical protein
LNQKKIYLDSFDRNSSIYISQSFKKEIFENDTKINGHFYVIEPSITYLIKIRIYSNYSVSSVKKYLYPFDFEKIDIKDDEKNFLYLKKDKSYTLDFKDNTINKMLKLSLKTLNSNIKINESDNLVINKDSQYYKLENDFKGQLILEVDKDDAFIEFLSNKGEPEFLDEISVKEHKLEKDVVVISIPRAHKFFSLDIKSDKNLELSLSIGLSQDKEYYYSSNSNDKINVQNEILFHYLPYKNIEMHENEFVSLAINFERQENQKINISYNLFSSIDEILDEKISKDYKFNRCLRFLYLF